MSTSPNSKSYERQSSMLLRSPEERKQVLRYGLTQAQYLEKCSKKDTLQMLEDIVNEVDDVYQQTSLEEKISNQDEVVLDSATMISTSKVLLNYGDSIRKTMNHYTCDKYAEHLVTYVNNLQNESIDDTPWHLLESEVVKCFQKIPIHSSSLLGALQPLEKKEFVRRTRMAKKPLGEIKKPAKLVTAPKEGESVKETVARIKLIILKQFARNKKPIDFFKLVLHPTSFSKTVENLLHLSFLVRDNGVEIKKDERGIIVIYPCSKEAIANTQARNSNNVQNALSFNMEQWKMLLDIYKINTSMIQ